MSKNLGNIPKQSAMEEAVEQAFTNGINKGRKLEREAHEKWLNRVRTWYEEKQSIWYEGYEYATNDIIKLWEIEMGCDCEDAMRHLKQRIEESKE